jgi:hypothetical protein
MRYTMAKIKLSREEIEKLLKEQFGCKIVVWDRNGDANIELDLEEIKKTETKVIEEHHHHHEYWPRPYPIYIGVEPVKKTLPYWTITSTSDTKFLSFKSK